MFATHSVLAMGTPMNASVSAFIMATIGSASAGRGGRSQNPGGNGMAAIVAGEGIAPARRTSVTDHDRR